MKGFGRRLENLREKTGYSKKEISFKLGFTANVYGAYEREDRRPTLETLIELADLFDVSLDYLIRGKEYKGTVSTQSEDPLEEIKRLIEQKGIDGVPSFLEKETLALLNKEEIQELNNYFEWVLEKARKRGN